MPADNEANPDSRPEASFGQKPVPPELFAPLYRISRLGGRKMQSKEALFSILGEIVRAFPVAVSGSISLIAPDTGHLEIEVEIGLPENAREFPLKQGEGITGWVALHGKPVRVPDTNVDPRYREARPNTQSEMAAPMIEGGHVTGVVNLDSDRINGFTDHDLQALILLTNEAAQAVRAIWRTNHLGAKSAHLEAMVSIGQRLGARLDLSEILHGIADETRALIACPLCAVLLLDTNGDELQHRSVSGEQVERHPDLPLPETSAGTAIAHRRQIEVLDLLKTEENFDLLQLTRDAALTSALFTPIIMEGAPMGVIAVYTSQTHRFNNEEKSLLDAMANLGAVAVNNASLYARVLQSEENLRRSEKLTALGLLAAEVAHEIRNPLTVIKLLFQSLALSFPQEDPREEDRRVIEEKLDQLDSIVGRVLNFARTSQDIRSRVALHDIITDTFALIRLKAAQFGIQTEFFPSADSLYVRGNKGQLQQVLLNLLLNSIQAMERGGKLSVTTFAEPRNGTEGASFEVTDTGKGIPEKVRGRIFESFLTERTDGSGLGLGIARQIIAAHQGAIEIVTTGPSGTRIKVWLPAFE